MKMAKRIPDKYFEDDDFSDLVEDSKIHDSQPILEDYVTKDVDDQDHTDDEISIDDQE